MKTCPPPPRSSAIGPLGTTSYTERSVTCLHCQKVHDRGFIWNFSDNVRVCFTCYRVMGDEGRKSYERKAARDKSTPAESPASEKLQSPAAKTTRASSGKIMVLLAFLIVLLGAGAFFVYKPLTGEVAEHRLWASESQTPAHR